MTSHPLQPSEAGLLLAWQRGSEPARFGFHPRPHADSNCLHGLRDEPEGHVVLVARSGAGKNRSGVMPWLLSHPGGVLTIDIKGENALVCACYRGSLGQPVHVFNPFGLQDAEFAGRGISPARSNPLDELDAAHEDFADCMTLAEELAGPAPANLLDPFWRSGGLGLISALIAWVVWAARHLVGTDPADCSLGGVWRMLCVQDLTYRMAVILDTHSVHPRFPPFVTEEFGNYLQAEGEKVRLSIRSEAVSLLRVFSSPRIQQATAASDFRLASLSDPQVRESIFIVMPAERLASHAALLRILLGRAFMAIARRTTQPAQPTLVVLDELAQIGAMPA